MIPWPVQLKDVTASNTKYQRHWDEQHVAVTDYFLLLYSPALQTDMQTTHGYEGPPQEYP